MPKHVEDCVSVVFIFQCMLGWLDKLNFASCTVCTVQYYKVCTFFFGPEFLIDVVIIIIIIINILLFLCVASIFCYSESLEA
jgi:hypothetical protein